jgi:predicted phage tail protein
LLVKVIPHGSLKGRYPEMEIDGATAAEVIEGWSRQTDMADMPIDKRPLIEVADFSSQGLLFDRLPEGTTELHVAPAMFGGGGGVGRVILGAAVAVVGIVMVALPGAGLTQMIGIDLIITGVGIAMGGVMQMMMRSPKMDSKSSNDDEGSKYINGATNSTAIGTRIGYGGGRMRVGGQFLSLQVNSSDMVYGQFPSTVPA